MKPGDLVRFRVIPESKWLIGLVVKFEKVKAPGIVTVLYDNMLYKATKDNVQKYGRRYLNEKG